VDAVLRNVVGTECWVFMDDVIIFSRSEQEHALGLKNISERFNEANIHLYPGKCVFAQPQVQYVDFALSGFSASPNTVKAVRPYPTPKSVKDVRVFLGLA